MRRWVVALVTLSLLVAQLPASARVEMPSRPHGPEFNTQHLVLCFPAPTMTYMAKFDALRFNANVNCWDAMDNLTVRVTLQSRIPWLSAYADEQIYSPVQCEGRSWCNTPVYFFYPAAFGFWRQKIEVSMEPPLNHCCPQTKVWYTRPVYVDGPAP